MKIRISSVGFLEVQSAFAMKVRSGVLDANSAGLRRSRFMSDIAAGEIEICTLTEDHMERVEQLIGRYSFQLRLRTLDALRGRGYSNRLYSC